jgi:hypothetical protein
MLSKKIRTGAAGLAAICALALAAAGPAAAENKWGHLGIGAQGHFTEGAGVCGDYQSLYDAAIDQMHGDISAGDYGAAFKDLDQAAQTRGDAHNAGCGWAWT